MLSTITAFSFVRNGTFRDSCDRFSDASNTGEKLPASGTRRPPDAVQPCERMGGAAANVVVV